MRHPDSYALLQSFGLMRLQQDLIAACCKGGDFSASSITLGTYQQFTDRKSVV